MQGQQYPGEAKAQLACCQILSVRIFPLSDSLNVSDFMIQYHSNEYVYHSGVRI